MPRLLDLEGAKGPSLPENPSPDHGLGNDLIDATAGWVEGASEVFSAARVNTVVRSLIGRNKTATRKQWLSAVAAHVVGKRPDIRPALLEVLGVAAAPSDLLDGLSIGEISVCYEALLAQIDRDKRKSSGQYFTPDDAAVFMAKQSLEFPKGVWLDPCCGVGNLSWHLAGIQPHPDRFIEDDLVLVDRDDTALKTAVALIGARFASPGNSDALRKLAGRAVRRDFLAQAPLPPYDFAILNPPYAKAPERRNFFTATTRDLFAYFLEKVATTSRGFVAVTPASYLSAPKFSPLRAVLDDSFKGGHVYVFDNVPDTLFRGFKYGSRNTSKTNFVRAAVTVCSPEAKEWQVTPILRWQIGDREAMFEEAPQLLSRRRTGPFGEWVKLAPESRVMWQELEDWPRAVQDLVVAERTPYFLDVATTPRYYVSASFRPLDRGSKVRLHFRDKEDRDLVALVLNSSVPYVWWRALDGGVTLPKRVLLSTPVPANAPPGSQEMIDALRASEDVNIVVKLNAGRKNENVKHGQDLVGRLNHALLTEKALEGMELVYANSMFPLGRFHGHSAPCGTVDSSVGAVSGEQCATGCERKRGE